MTENNNQPIAVDTSAAPEAAPVNPAPEANPAPAAAPVAPAAKKSNKKKIILISSICGSVAVLGIAAAIIIPMLLSINYGEAYLAAKEAKTALSDYYSSSACSNADYYLNSRYTSESSYEEYLSACAQSMENNPTAAVDKLANTGAVKRDENIKKQFEAFYAEFQKSAITDEATLNKKFDLYKTWHKFIIAKSDLKTGALDAEIAAAASPLMNSGDDSLKTYAEGWISKRIAYARTYTAWYESVGYYNTEYDKYREASNALETYEEESLPDFVKVAGKNSSNSSDVYTEFSRLFDLIADAYELHYNHGSGDCMEVLNQVYCNL